MTNPFQGGKMKQAFYKISEEKRQLIVEAALKEFSRHAFHEASLNQIIKDAGISKGGMFKYIEDKTDLYIYVVEEALTFLTNEETRGIEVDEPCYVTRYFNMLLHSQSYYLEHPLMIQLLIMAKKDFNSPCFEQVNVMSYEAAKEKNQMLEATIKWTQYDYSKEQLQRLLKTMTDGIEIELLHLLTGDGYYNIDQYFNHIKEQRDMILNGLRR